MKNSYPDTKLVFPSFIVREDKKDTVKNVNEINKRWRHFCHKKNINFFDNSNISKDQRKITSK